ncbi:hypothetical protein GCM10017783_25480 [Deinococcus piscis]|uniref:Uncharacterized protein n=1 Tax=Deinococcus piscis TaxID=394230 RepID=A0ABQ3KBA9_9DEIO|nr:hypothetical protein [Deinococcus piscis]GHG12219.1 hypothetical protein GCM10017783_25480 [Deinococcus piscis]
MSDSSDKHAAKNSSRQSFSAAELLHELFPGSAEVPQGANGQPTLGLYPVADGRLALVCGQQLAEFTPLSGQAKTALHCDLCHYTRSPSEATIYRVVVAQRRSRYVTLCHSTVHCQGRAGTTGLQALAERIFPIESGAQMF